MTWNFKDFNGNTAIIQEDGSKVAYADLLTASDKLVKQIGKRALVCNLCSNTTGSLLGYIAFLEHKIVPFLAEAGLSRELLDLLLSNYKPDYLWCPSGMVEDFPGALEVYSDFDYSLLKTTYFEEYPLYDELALLLTTSGSTGSPKLVRQSYENIKANTASIVEYLKLDAKERPITTLPMSYTYGLSILNTHLYAGASIILTDKTMMQREFWQQFKQYEATSFGGVPYNYEILDKLRFLQMELPSLRTMTQAGGKLSPELHKKFAEYAQEKGKNFVVIYGQTEATARMSYLPPDKALEKYGSVGIAIPGGNLSLIDTDGNTINEPDTVGELVYDGKNVTLGYAQCGEDLAKEDERNGILYTGDMAKQDEDGFFYIVGRRNRFLKIFGKRVNLDEVERMLKTSFSDTDFACGGQDDKMYVFLTGSSSLDDVKKYLAEITKLNPITFQVIKINQIPRNDSGKVIYRELDKYYAS